MINISGAESMYVWIWLKEVEQSLQCHVMFHCQLHWPCFVIDDFKTQPPVDRWFRPVSSVLNNDNWPEPDGTAGQPAVGILKSPLKRHILWSFFFWCNMWHWWWGGCDVNTYENQIWCTNNLYIFHCTFQCIMNLKLKFVDYNEKNVDFFFGIKHLLLLVEP